MLQCTSSQHGMKRQSVDESNMLFFYFLGYDRELIFQVCKDCGSLHQFENILSERQALTCC